jgi:LysR family transcriptional regulator, hydrogen peroxide-inducible genes activator
MAYDVAVVGLGALCLAGEDQFRRAAAHCHVSQPTLSAQIAKLEDELGVQLFKRGSRAATPTVNGRSLLRQAQVVLDEVERLRALARARVTCGAVLEYRPKRYYHP